MARYIEATETSDERLRDSMLSEILQYNRKDLAATWAVLSWLRRFENRCSDPRSVEN
jgi:predicted RecB family nuclease